MRAPVGEASAELIVRRSRFIARAIPIHDNTDAETAIKRRRAEYADASHVVYAYSWGDEVSRQFGMSDDGEPKGTAGRPVLEILKGSEVTDCLITIVRYFGGTKLGTGGLVHAYGEVARLCLERLRTVEKRVTRRERIRISYELHNTLSAALSNLGVEIRDEAFSDYVDMEIEFDIDETERVSALLRDVSRGTILLN